MGGGAGKQRDMEKMSLTGTALLFTSGGHMPTDTGSHHAQDQDSGTDISSEVGSVGQASSCGCQTIRLILTQPHPVPGPPVHRLGLLRTLGHGHRAGKGALQRCEGQRA